MKKEKGSIYWAVILSVAFVIGIIIASDAFKFRYTFQDDVSVTGMGEIEFKADLAVWNSTLVAGSKVLEDAYATIENNGKVVREYLKSQGIADSLVQFMFVNVDDVREPVYSNGNYVGVRSSGYSLRQQIKVESTDVALIESVSRGISSLIAKGVILESSQPEYYYTALSEIKLELIEKATEDGRIRAEKIADKAGAKLGGLASAKMGVIQITAPNSSENYSWGGALNLHSKDKKATITMKLVYHLK